MFAVRTETPLGKRMLTVIYTLYMCNRQILLFENGRVRDVLLALSMHVYNKNVPIPAAKVDRFMLKLDKRLSRHHKHSKQIE